MDKPYDKIIIFTPKSIYRYFYQFVEAITHSFSLLGYDITFANEVNEEFNDTESILLIIIADPLNENTKLVCKYTKQDNITTVVYETEAFIHTKKISYRYDEYNIDYLWTYSHVVIDSIKDHLQCPMFYLPPGYSSLYNYIIDTDIESQPITFINAKSEKRLEPLKKHLPNITNICKCWTHQSFKDNISKYFILINVHKLTKAKALEMFRIAPFLSSGFKVISEHCYFKDEIEYKDFITFLDVSEIPHYIESQLNDSNEYKLNIKKSISKQFEEKFDLTNTLRNVLTQMNLLLL